MAANRIGREPAGHPTSVVLDPDSLGRLDSLRDQLCLTTSAVVRLAILRLHQAETLAANRVKKSRKKPDSPLDS